jgi:hypothetical protein
MYYQYVFLKRVSNMYFEAISFDRIYKEVGKFLNMEKYDFAARIDDAAMRLILSARAKGYIPLIKYDFGDLVSFDKVIVFNQDEFRNQVLKAKIDALESGKYQSINDIDDEDLKNEYIFEKKKNYLLQEILNRSFPKFNMYDIFNLIDYLNHWSYLFSKGFIITDENKEDIFIEIIEKDDDKLLDTLEKYLESKENFDQFKTNFVIYQEVKSDLEYLSYWEFDNIDEALDAIDGIRNKYLSKNGDVVILEQNTIKDRELFLNLKLKNFKQEES